MLKAFVGSATDVVSVKVPASGSYSGHAGRAIAVPAGHGGEVGGAVGVDDARDVLGKHGGGALAVRTAAAREQLGRHVAHEETDALALAQRVLAPAERKAVLEAFNEGLGPSDFSFLVPWVLHELPAPDQRITKGKDRVLGWLNIVFRRPWLRRERVAFRYA